MEILFLYLFIQSSICAVCIFEIFVLLHRCTLPMLTLQPGTLTEVMTEKKISCSVIHFTSPLPYPERYVNLSAALGVHINDPFRILPCLLKR